MIKTKFAEIDYCNEFLMGIFETNEGGKNKTIARLTFEELPESGYVHEPTITLNKLEIQFMMDSLWKIGIRPSNGEGNAGQLGATEKHLEDMRKLVFEGIKCR